MAPWIRSCLPMLGTRVPCLDGIPLGVGQLSPCATTTEPALQGPGAITTEACGPRALLHNKRSHCNEKPKLRNKEQLLLEQPEQALMKAMKTQHSQKLNKY